MTAVPPRPKQLDAPIVPKLLEILGRARGWIFRRTGGRIGGKWRIGAGLRKPVPTLLLEHRGRKSGTDYTTPLLYITDGADTIVVASTPTPISTPVGPGPNARSRSSSRNPAEPQQVRISAAR